MTSANLRQWISSSPSYEVPSVIDTSNNYGDGTSERRVGKAIALAGGAPDDFLVITKVDRAGDDFSGARVRESFRESLERLGVQSVPLLFLHDPDAFEFGYMASAGGAVDALVQIRDEGLADAIGVATDDTRLWTAEINGSSG